MTTEKIAKELKEDYALREQLKKKGLKVQDKLENEISELEQSLINSKIIPELEDLAKALLDDLQCEVNLNVTKEYNGQITVSQSNEYEDHYPPTHQANLFSGLQPVNITNDMDIVWVLGCDSDGIIPIIRSNGKYGLFRAAIEMGMGASAFYGPKDSFQYDDVRMCVPALGGAMIYDGYIALQKDGKWKIALIDIDSHPLTIVEDCDSFETAKNDFETFLGKKSPNPWWTFDGKKIDDITEDNNSLTGDDDSVDSPAPSDDGNRKKAKSIGFCVTFPDGTLFNDKKAVDVFVKTIAKVGYDNVQKLGITRSNCNIVSDVLRTDVNNGNSQKWVSGKYIYVKLSNGDKKDILHEISSRLNLNLKIQDVTAVVQTTQPATPQPASTNVNAGYNRSYSPQSIKTLKQGQIFVFGSNLAGHHSGAAAAQAMRDFGAIWGQGEGMQGQSYAIPTMHGAVNTIKPYVDNFIAYAKANPQYEFLVTRIGCGVAGFKDADIAPLFKTAVPVANILLPKSFVDVLENNN